MGSTILTSVIGDEAVCFTIGINVRCYDSMHLAAQDAADSRVWCGIHCSFDNAAGLALANQIAGSVLAGHAFQPVLETATCVMMILGFGFMGSLTRRRRLHVRYA